MSIAIDQHPRLVEVRVSEADDAALTATVDYVVRASTTSAARLPDALEIELTLEAGKATLDGEPVEIRFRPTPTVRLEDGDTSAGWTTSLIVAGMPAALSLPVTARVPDIDATSELCGRTVPFQLSTDWAIASSGGGWTFAPAEGTSTDDPIDAFVDCGTATL